MADSFGPYFQDIYMFEDKRNYVRSHYDTTAGCTGNPKKSMRKRNVIGFVRNNLVEKINDQITFPKYIIVVLDADIVKSIHNYKTGASQAYGAAIDWLVTEFHRITTAHKEKLPSRSRKFKYPQILWVPAVLHDQFTDNVYREKYNKCLVSVVEMFREMHILNLHSWDTLDVNCISNNKMTAIGLEKYWEAINDAFQAWDKEQMRSSQQSGTNRNFARHQQRNDRYHWSSQNRILPAKFSQH